MKSHIYLSGTFMTESLHVQVGDNKNVLIGSMGNMTVLLPLDCLVTFTQKD